MQNCNSKFKTDIHIRCYRFSINIISFLETLPKNDVNQIIKHQLLRSATSIGANLIEAKAASSKLEFRRYNEISLRSANETKYWLSLMKTTFQRENNQFDSLLTEATEIANMLASGILKLKNKKF